LAFVRLTEKIIPLLGGKKVSPWVEYIIDVILNQLFRIGGFKSSNRMTSAGPQLTCMIMHCLRVVFAALNFGGESASQRFDDDMSVDGVTARQVVLSRFKYTNKPHLSNLFDIMKKCANVSPDFFIPLFVCLFVFVC
jgi:hypothetical protein